MFPYLRLRRDAVNGCHEIESRTDSATSEKPETAVQADRV
ncbi:hypothetical protein BN903_60 [Halorubrum sp. AJ67]|nr:hypothetical protein BN903_60 [Halorubrum sp. AJ67]